MTNTERRQYVAEWEPSVQICHRASDRGKCVTMPEDECRLAECKDKDCDRQPNQYV